MTAQLGLQIEEVEDEDGKSHDLHGRERRKERGQLHPRKVRARARGCRQRHLLLRTELLLGNVVLLLGMFCGGQIYFMWLQSYLPQNREDKTEICKCTFCRCKTLTVKLPFEKQLQ